MENPEIVIKNEKIKTKGLLSQTLVLPKKIATLLEQGKDVMDIKAKYLWDYGYAKKYIIDNKKKLFQKGYSYKIATVFDRGARTKKNGAFTANEEPQFYADAEEYDDPLADSDIVGFVIYRLGAGVKA